MDAQKGPVEMTRITFIEDNICLGLQNTSELMVVEGRLIRFLAYMLIDIPTLLASKARPFPPAFFTQTGQCAFATSVHTPQVKRHISS